MNLKTEGGLITLEARRDRIHLRMTALHLGRDLCVTLSGGDRPHIGAVALGRSDATTSTLTLPQHREDELARSIATQLAARFDTAVCVACGIHLDDILSEEISSVLEMAETLTRQLGEHLEEMSP
jgi:hypothetical protein